MKTAALFVIALALVLPMCAKAQSTNITLPSATLKWKRPAAAKLDYLLYLPPDYSAKARGPRWPVMLFLHGSGERGTDVQRVAVHGPLSLVKQGTNFPFIIAAPLCAAGQKWENEPLLALLDHIEGNYRVDTNRVYLTGLSMGGYGTWTLGLAQPERFAALAPICGGVSFIDLLFATRERMPALRQLPIWTFHGGLDDVVPLDESKRVVDFLKGKGVTNVTFTVYPEAKHNSWSQTYGDPKFYEWLLAQRRKTN